ncbi:MAG: DeoR/GlpR transcriptional regulator [Anaerohalosphaera sp.]|nr:DeoR/GlpR transcriptional regulator [Anaerohalosphaera sp.]
MGLLAEKRHQYILDKIQNLGRIQVSDLAQEMAVTEVTIRRDLAKLQNNGMLKKTYGGAILPGRPELIPSVQFRQTKNLSAKKTIGKLACQMIHNGDNIYFEAGSTCYEIIPYLTQYKNLTIIVNSLHLMKRLHELTLHKVIITGGQYRPERMDMVGPVAEATISQLAGFTAFTGADDISLDTGISGADVTTVSFAKLVLKRASLAVFVGDHTKFDKPSLYKIADLENLHCIVTDKAPSKKWHQVAEKKKVKLIYPDSI